MPTTTPSAERRISPISLRGALVLGASFALVSQVGVATAASADEHSHGHVADAYTLELLQPTGENTLSGALGINDDGDVVGTVRGSTAQPQWTAVWERHGDHFHSAQLPNLEGSTFSRGFDVNNSGIAVGEAFAGTPQVSVPITWSSGTATRITAFNEAGTGILNDINDAGTAVGAASGRAVQLSAAGEPSVLPDPTGLEAGTTVKNSTASSVSSTGETAGRITLSVPHGDHSHDEYYPVKWAADGTAQVLSLPDGTTGVPTVAEITDGGEILGAATIGGRETAVAWGADGSAEPLPAPTIADYVHTRANAGTADDLFVGYASKFAGNTSFGGAAIAWDAHGPVNLNERVEDLPEGVNLLSAADINAGGQIAGTAQTPSGNRGFVLTPVADEPVDPEPTDPEPPAPIKFIDVPKSHKFYTQIQWMAQNKITTGTKTPKGLAYQPKKATSREAMAAFLYRMYADDDYVAPAKSPFVDVPKSHKFYKQIAWMAEEGISTGTKQKNGTVKYEPKVSTSREAMAAFLYRAEGVKGFKAPSKSPFVDVKKSDKFYTQIAWMAAEGISTGTKTSKGKVYEPKASTSREAMSAFLYRIAN